MKDETNKDKEVPVKPQINYEVNLDPLKMNLPFYEVLEQYKKRNNFLFECEEEDMITNII